jgi:hypothetical protein
MPYTTLALGITLRIPTSGTKSWGPTVLSDTWTKISQHRHTGSGDGNQIPTGGIVNRAVTSGKLALNIAHGQGATLTPSGTTQDIDFDDGNTQRLDLSSASGDVTLTFSNPQAGAVYRLLIEQAATPRAITWPVAVLWPQGQAPILSDSSGAVDMIELYYDGTSYFGKWEVDFQ